MIHLDIQCVPLPIFPLSQYRPHNIVLGEIKQFNGMTRITVIACAHIH